MISAFAGQYRFLSNFYQSVVRMDGVDYPTVEHAFQAAKNPSAAYRERVASAREPGHAKRLGRMVMLRADWEHVKLDVMLALLRIKFYRGGDLADRLLATGDHELVEGNTWGDAYWGVCNGVGENHLGKLLMQVRGELR